MTNSMSQPNSPQLPRVIKGRTESCHWTVAGYTWEELGKALAEHAGEAPSTTLDIHPGENDDDPNACLQLKDATCQFSHPTCAWFKDRLIPILCEFSTGTVCEVTAEHDTLVLSDGSKHRAPDWVHFKTAMDDGNIVRIGDAVLNDIEMITDSDLDGTVYLIKDRGFVSPGDDVETCSASSANLRFVGNHADRLLTTTPLMVSVQYPQLGEALYDPRTKAQSIAADLEFEWQPTASDHQTLSVKFFEPEAGEVSGANGADDPSLVGVTVASVQRVLQELAM